jgi:hypothetical protein
MSLQYPFDLEYNYAPGGICLGLCTTYKSPRAICTCTEQFPPGEKKNKSPKSKKKSFFLCKVLLKQIEDNYSLTTDGAVEHYEVFKHGNLMDKKEACDKHICEYIKVILHVG